MKSTTELLEAIKATKPIPCYYCKRVFKNRQAKNAHLRFCLRRNRQKGIFGFVWKFLYKLWYL